MTSTTNRSSQALMPQSSQPPKTPKSELYQYQAWFGTPPQSQNSTAQHYEIVPQHQPMGTQQLNPAAYMPPQQEGFYTPQHRLSYAPQIHQAQNQSLPQGYYATPPASQPPFLRSPAQFSSSAPLQSSPTPRPMTAFHNGSIPTSSGSVPSNRQPLTPASSNIQKTNAIPRGKEVEQPFVLPPDQYLSWHELERHYGPARQHFHSDDAYKSARLDWVKTIKMD